MLVEHSLFKENFMSKGGKGWLRERESRRNVNRKFAQDKLGLENQTENFALRTRMKPPVTSAQGNTIR